MSLAEFWFDINDYYIEEKFIDLKKFLFIYLHGSKNLEKIPSIRFWAICIIYAGYGMKILMGDGTIWTIEGLFEELNELLEKKIKKCPSSLGI